MKIRVNFSFVILALLVSMAPAETAAPSGKQSTRKFPANSKSSSPAAGKLVALKVTGSQRYTEKEILPASGLQLGQSVGEGDFKEAARRLGDTGLFSDVVYSYSYSGSETKLELQLTDVEKSKLVPADFENIVWFTDAVLLNELQTRVPLFKGFVPVAALVARGDRSADPRLRGPRVSSSNDRIHIDRQIIKLRARSDVDRVPCLPGETSLF